MIDEKRAILGENFRGLWQSRELTSKARFGVRRGLKLPKEYYIIKWVVTFKFNGDLLETEPQDTEEEALDYAIDFLGLNGTK